MEDPCPLHCMGNCLGFWSMSRTNLWLYSFSKPGKKLIWMICFCPEGMEPKEGSMENLGDSFFLSISISLIGTSFQSQAISLSFTRRTKMVFLYPHRTFPKSTNSSMFSMKISGMVMFDKSFTKYLAPFLISKGTITSFLPNLTFFLA